MSSRSAFSILIALNKVLMNIWNPTGTVSHPHQSANILRARVTRGYQLTWSGDIRDGWLLGFSWSFILIIFEVVIVVVFKMPFRGHRGPGMIQSPIFQSFKYSSRRAVIYQVSFYIFTCLPSGLKAHKNFSYLMIQCFLAVCSCENHQIMSIEW